MWSPPAADRIPQRYCAAMADTNAASVIGSIERPPARYLESGTRDFVAMFAR